MALTIEQIQQNITDKRDLREVFNQLADYIQANPGGGDSGLLSATVELTDAQIKALPTTPVQIIAAGGANTYIHFISGITYAHLVDPYGNVEAISLNLRINGTDIASVTQDFLEGSSDDYVVTMPPTATSNGTTGLENQPLMLEADNGGAGNYTGGNAANTLKVTVYYVVVDL